MEHSRITQIPINQPFVGNQAPVRSFSPAFSPEGGILPVDETEMNVFDVDRSLPGMFSMLNLSPATYGGESVPLSVYRNGFGGRIRSSVGDGESFGRSDLGVDCLLNRRRFGDEMEGFQRDYGSGFDFGFDFDRKCSLESKKTIYSNPEFESMVRCSSSFGSEVVDKKLKLKILDDYEQKIGSCSGKFYNQQSQSQSQGQGQNQLSQFMNLWSLKELRGGIYTMAKDQNGCRILQAMIERSTMEEVEFVLCEVVDMIGDLMKDQFGNYLVQKLVALCNEEQKTRLILSLTEVPSDIILVCMNPHGTRAMQKLLENLNANQVKVIIKAIYRGAATLAMDPNGHHVIQYCLINFDSDVNKPILTEIANQCYKIATDRSGCCVLQACVEHSRGEVRRRIITEIMVNAVHLAEDPFGNYVLQHILGLNMPELTALLVRQLKGNFASLSCNKYASNVVEKCLNESGEEMSTRIIMELVGSPNSSLLLVDPYANFVIQSALKVSKGFAHDSLCYLISKNMLSMRTNLYGKKILERLEKKRVNIA